MDHIFRLILIGGLFFFAACKTVDEEALDTAEVSQQTLTPEETIVSNMPDWCLNLPSSEVALYRCGIGESSDLNMARNRAGRRDSDRF